MNAEQYQAIKDRLNKATPGPWKNIAKLTTGEDAIAAKELQVVCWVKPGENEDTQFIVHAIEDIQALIEFADQLHELRTKEFIIYGELKDEIERLRKEKQILMKTLEEIACDSAESTAGILRKTRQILGEEQ